MGKNTSQIKLSEGEAVKVIHDLVRMIFSPRQDYFMTKS